MRPGTFPKWPGAVLMYAYAVGFCVLVWMADAGLLKNLYGAIDQVPGSDKLGHLILIGGLAWALNSLLGWRRISGGLLAGSLIVAIGTTTEEISQAWNPNRHFDLLDLTANLAGICLVSGMCLFRSQKP